MWKEETSTEAPARQVHSIKGLHTVRESYSRTTTNGHLSTTAISLPQPLLLADRSYIDSCLNLSTTAVSPRQPLLLADRSYIDSCLNLSTAATSLQRPLSSVPKVAVVKRLNCIGYQTQKEGTAPSPFLSSPTPNMWNIRIRCLNGPCQ